MNKKELSEAVGEGVYEGISKIMWEFTKGVMYAIAIFILLGGIWFAYHEMRYDNSDVQTTTQQIQNCNYPYLECKIYEANRYWACNGKVYPVSVYVELEPKSNITGLSITKSNESCKDVSSHAVLITNRVCGYSEANAWFEQVNKNHEGLYKLKMECN